MKRILNFAAIAVMTLSSCAKEKPDESVLSNLPCFEYLGYTYYLHPHLAIYDDGFDYRDVRNRVKALDSYGFDSWFIPSSKELQIAAYRRILGGGLCYISSTMDKDGHYLCIYHDEYEAQWKTSAFYGLLGI